LNPPDAYSCFLYGLTGHLKCLLCPISGNNNQALSTFVNFLDGAFGCFESVAANFFDLNRGLFSAGFRVADDDLFALSQALLGIFGGNVPVVCFDDDGSSVGIDFLNGGVRALYGIILTGRNTNKRQSEDCHGYDSYRHSGIRDPMHVSAEENTRLRTAGPAFHFTPSLKDGEIANASADVKSIVTLYDSLTEEARVAAVLAKFSTSVAAPRTGYIVLQSRVYFGSPSIEQRAMGRRRNYS